MQEIERIGRKLRGESKKVVSVGKRKGEEEEEENSIMAFSSDYHPPKPHPPKNNWRERERERESNFPPALALLLTLKLKLVKHIYGIWIIVHQYIVLYLYVWIEIISGIYQIASLRIFFIISVDENFKA